MMHTVHTRHAFARHLRICYARCMHYATHANVSSRTRLPTLDPQVMGMRVYMPPPPSSAVTLMPALNFLAGYDLPAPAAGLLNYHRCGFYPRLQKSYIHLTTPVFTLFIQPATHVSHATSYIHVSYIPYHHFHTHIPTFFSCQPPL